MNDKEYTYDIGKYTIGVDENGEDGIGMTVAIIKNGEINLLGDCYGENARCIDLLIKENQALKKKLEEANKKLYLCTPEIPQNSHNNYISYVDLINKLYSIEKENEKLKTQLKGTTHCYDEEEHRKLKKQYENAVADYETTMAEKVELERQFVKYLEDEIKRINPKDLDIGELNLRLDDIKFTQYLIYKETLQKCKEIIGVLNEKKK